MRSPLILILSIAAFLFAGCAGSRPAIIGNGSQVADLWWAGELTDQAGNRWDVAILPGMAPTFHDAGASFSRSAERFANYADGAYWRQVGTMSKDCFAFAGADCLRDFVVYGIGEDYSDTGGSLCRLASERPFGWIAQIAWRTLWGYAIKPVGRIALGPVGAVGGVGAGALVPVGGALYPPVVGAGDVALLGITVPTARIVWNQVAWTVCLLNSEPDEKQNGQWGLRIIKRPPGWKPPATDRAAADPAVIDRDRLERLLVDLVELERSIATQARRRRLDLLPRPALERPDGAPATVQVTEDARAWFASEAPTACSRLLAALRARDPSLELPSADAILDLLRQALGLAAPPADSGSPLPPATAPSTVPPPARTP